jgi:hypothetical protein
MCGWPRRGLGVSERSVWRWVAQAKGRVYHPVWAQVDAELIAYVDAHAGHGNFRAWSKVTAHVITALARLQRHQPDREVLQWVFSRLGSQDG